jgi:hypothetical protein
LAKVSKQMVKAMKACSLFFLLSFFSVTLQAASALEKTVTLSMYNRSLEDVLNEISRQTGIRFSYSPQAVDVSRITSLEAQRQPVKEILPLVLGGKYEYKITRNFAILRKAQVKINLSPEFEQRQHYEAERAAEKVAYSYITNQQYVKNLCYTDSGTVGDGCPIITVNKNFNQNSEVMKKYLAAIMLATTATTATATGVSAQAQQPSTVSEQLDKAGKEFISLVEGAVVSTAQAVKIAADEVRKRALSMNAAAAYSGSDTVSMLKVGPEPPSNPSVQVAVAQAAAQEQPAAAATATNRDTVRPVIFTFFYPFSFPELHTERHAYSASLSCFYGVNSGVREVELGGLVNINLRYMSGAQLAGVSNLSFGSVTGTQLAGIANLAVRDTAIAQLAGIANLAQSAGFQGAGIANAAQSAGFQGAGIANAAQSAGFQGAGIANLAQSAGFQGAGIANLAQSAGFQLAGIANVASAPRFQAGLVNVAQRSGVQAGLVNVCDTSTGVMVGLLNIAKRGGLHELQVSAELANAISVAYRLGIPKCYTFWELSFRADDNLWLSGVGVGTQISLPKNWGINVEGLSQHALTKSFWKHGAINQLSQVRVLGYKRFAKYFAVFAGPALYVYHTNTKISGSVDLVAPYSIYAGQCGRTASKVWAGFSAGIRL